MNHEHFLGYTKDAKGNLIVDKKEAKVVKRIFREYLEGASFRDIAMGLEQDHIKTGGNVTNGIRVRFEEFFRMRNTSVMPFCRRPSQQILSKTRIKNDGTVPQYYVKNSQEAIIPRDVFYTGSRGNAKTSQYDKWERWAEAKDLFQSVCTLKHLHLHEMWGYI